MGSDIGWSVGGIRGPWERDPEHWGRLGAAGLSAKPTLGDWCWSVGGQADRTARRGGAVARIASPSPGLLGGNAASQPHMPGSPCCRR